MTSTETAMNALHLLLDRNLQHPPEFRPALSNHLPMALHALQQLGADEARLHTFFQTYARRFAGLAPALAAQPLADWRQALGHIEAFDPLRAGNWPTRGCRPRCAPCCRTCGPAWRRLPFMA
jgi:hypothetical protein